MTDALTRAARAIKDTLGEALNATPLTHTPSHTAAGDWTATASYSVVELDAIARAAILSFLSGEDVVEACARGMRQSEVNDDEDGWAYLNGWDRAEFRRQAHNAIAALRALVQEDGK